MNQPGGQTLALGGATTVQAVPTQLISGKMVRPPIVLPWVLEVAMNDKRERANQMKEIDLPPMRETLILPSGAEVVNA